MKPRSGSRRKPAYPDPKQWQHPAPEGHQAILNAVNTALTPGGFQPRGLDLPKGRLDREEITDLATLHQAMVEETWEDTARAAAKWAETRFSCTPGQQLTLAQAGVPAESIQYLAALDGLLRPRLYDTEAIQVRLAILAQLPETVITETENPPTERAATSLQPKPKQWFLQLARQRIGLPRPIEDPEDANYETDQALLQILEAVTSQWADQLPTWLELASSLQEQPWKQDKWTNPGKPRQELTMSNLLEFGDALRRAARAAGIGRARLDYYQDTPPEEIKQLCTEAGITMFQDCGRLQAITPAQLHRIYREQGRKLPYLTDGTYEVNRECQLWYTGSPPPPTKSRRIILQREPQAELTEDQMAHIQQLHWYAEAVPKDYSDPAERGWDWLSMNQHNTERAHYAQALEITQDILQAYLDQDDPEQPLAENPTTPCARAAECATGCGRAQAEGRRNYPLTRDGKAESCGWYRFLELYGERPLETQEAAAKQWRQEAAAQRKIALREEAASRKDLPWPEEWNGEAANAAVEGEAAPAGNQKARTPAYNGKQQPKADQALLL